MQILSVASNKISLVDWENGFPVKMKISFSNEFPVSQFFPDITLEIPYIIFYPDQSGSMSFTFPILHLIPPLYSCEKDSDIRDVESRRIQMLISVVYNTHQVRDRNPSHHRLPKLKIRGVCDSLCI